MAEGGFEWEGLDVFGGADEDDRLLPEEETSFNEPELPSWAEVKEEPEIGQNDVADADELYTRLSQFDAERVKYSRQTNLEFKASKNGALWVRWGDKWLRLTAERDPTNFLSAATIKKAGGSQLARALGLIPESSQRGVADALRKAESQIPMDSQLENIPLRDLPRAANGVEALLLELTPELPELTLREFVAHYQAVQRHDGELVNNLAKMSTLKDQIDLDERKLDEAKSGDVDESIIDNIEKRLRGLKDEYSARQEAASANREALRSQISRIRETIRSILNEDTTLAERIRTLFREQGVTIASILTAIGLAISTLVLALTGGGGGGTPPAPPPSDKGGLREWVKKHLESLGRALAKLAGKAAAALPGVIGSIVSWLLGTLGKVTSWAANNIWAVAVAIGGLLLVAARRWVTTSP